MVPQAEHRASHKWPDITQHTGGHGQHTKSIESCKGVRCRPPHSSTDVCKRGAIRQRPGGANTPSGMSPHSQRARLTLGLVCQGDGIHQPMSQPLFGDSHPLLLSSKADKKLLGASKSPGAFHVNAQGVDGAQQCKDRVCLLRGQHLQVHHLVSKGIGGNLGHITRPRSQGNVRINRPKLKARFVDRECLQVPHPLDGSERDQERSLERQMF